MTINTTIFTDWARRPATDLARYKQASPNLVAIRDDLRVRFPGSVSLGIYGVRDQRGHAGVLSTHSFGAALDHSYRGLGRDVGRAMIDFLVSNSHELGVQAVHDYVGCTIWRSVRDGNPGGWRQQKPSSSGMGQPWADWLHIEVTADAWADGRAVAVRLGGAPATPTPARPRLGIGARGVVVATVQTIIAERSGQAAEIGAIDGVLGPRTLKAWQNVAAFCGWPVDQDIVGKDYDLLAWIDQGWGRLNAVGIR